MFSEYLQNIFLDENIFRIFSWMRKSPVAAGQSEGKSCCHNCPAALCEHLATIFSARTNANTNTNAKTNANANTYTNTKTNTGQKYRQAKKPIKLTMEREQTGEIR